MTVHNFFSAPNKLQHQYGIGLVEIVIALLLLSVAILGFVALQTTAIKSTDESLERSQSLVVMRNIGEKIRANPSEDAILAYVTNINTPQKSAPTKMCGLDSSTNTATTDSLACTSIELAKAESFQITQELAQFEFDVQLHPCPTSTGTYADNTMYSYCMISAWGDTVPTVEDKPNANPQKDDPPVSTNYCIKQDGKYRSAATCILMEI